MNRYINHSNTAGRATGTTASVKPKNHHATSAIHITWAGRPPQQTAYRALFRSQLDDAAIADIRLALTQNQPLGNTKFSDSLCVAAGMRRTQGQRGRPAGKAKDFNTPNTQPNFGF